LTKVRFRHPPEGSNGLVTSRSFDSPGLGNPGQAKRGVVRGALRARSVGLSAGVAQCDGWEVMDLALGRLLYCGRNRHMDLGIPRNPRFFILFYSFLSLFSNSDFQGYTDRLLIVLLLATRDYDLVPSFSSLCFSTIVSCVYVARRPTLPSFFSPSLTHIIASIVFFSVPRARLSSGLFFYLFPVVVTSSRFRTDPVRERIWWTLSYSI